jgi:DNA excision repair protein ERCC-3
LAVMERVGQATLILTTNTTAVRQWIGEIRDKTDLPTEWVGEYTGERKEVRPVTVATYQILTHRREKDGPFEHMQLFQERNWGLIIYDEVHLLPAPIFRATAELQAKRRLGLTATLVREDGREEDVFSLIGPKKYDVPWKELEAQGWIADARCVEIRVPMPVSLRRLYIRASKRQKYRIVAENPEKLPVLEEILTRHREDRVLIIGQYLSQLREIADRLSAPLITGQMKQAGRDVLFDRFRRGELPVLVVSKVANFAVDLPDASVAVQVSGTFGSRQEEAQRLGRILRPKPGENRAYFYNLVTRDSLDQEYALHRQLFLVEQGDRYEVREAEGWREKHGEPVAD